MTRVDSSPSSRRRWPRRQSLVVTAKFKNTTGAAIRTIKPDCINTTFTVMEGDFQLDPIIRERMYGIPDDLVTIPNNAEVQVVCDLAEMFDPTILSADGTNSATYTVTATYANHIIDRTCPGGVGCIPDIWIGAVSSCTSC